MQEKTENRIDRKLAYQANILKIYEDLIKFPDGHTAKYDYIHHKGAAAVLPVTDDQKILMVHQYRNALDRFTIEIPAGALDSEDEPGLACATRELEEETGYRAGTMEHLLTLRTTVAFCDEKIDVFVAKNLIPAKQHLDPEENIVLKSYTLEELHQLIYSGIIQDSKTVAAIMAYSNQR